MQTDHLKLRGEKRIQEGKDRLRDTIVFNIHIMGIHKEKKKKGQRTYLKKIMMETCPNLRKEMDIKIQDALSTRMNPKRTTLRHIVTHVSKDKDKVQFFFFFQTLTQGHFPPY